MARAELKDVLCGEQSSASQAEAASENLKTCEPGELPRHQLKIRSVSTAATTRHSLWLYLAPVSWGRRGAICVNVYVCAQFCGK